MNSWTVLLIVACAAFFPLSVLAAHVNFKGYSGIRAYNRSTVVVYQYDQTIAVVELGPDRLLLNCELIEVYEPQEKMMVLNSVSKLSKRRKIKLEQMLDLMARCGNLETPSSARKFTSSKESESRSGPSSLFSGVIPGTKWCGSGDIASSYYDLGEESAIDRCCRTHDICPSKIRGHSSRYNLTNDNMYTKSHCKCDAQFQRCLKSTNSPTADIMGHFYFNLLKVPCIEEQEGKKIIHSATSYN